MKDISLYVMAAFYVFAGVNHFLKPKFYLRLMPPYLPWHKAMNYLSGVIEVLLGVLLFFPAYSTIAAWGVIALLLWLRLPFQALFLLWAWWHTF
jgi:uncharacterized membrane protein